MFFCLPIVFGCPTHMKQEGDKAARICPKCNNASVIRVNSRSCFELCFVPLIPMKKKHLWWCTTCQWNVPLQSNWEPALPVYGQGYPNSPPPNAYHVQYPDAPVQKRN